MATRQKEKAAARQENRDTRPRAVLRYARISARKVRPVIDQIRGKRLEEAEAILMLSPRGASEAVAKLVKSAAANAENNLDMARDSLYIAEIFCDVGPTLKRYRPRARGSAARIMKRTSHITVILDQVK
ncbi:MAG: 50S ribosomal protein L22 [Clostridia bacterium]|nr:50S ribosomal protein L22 [Clostridia bacterium]